MRKNGQRSSVVTLGLILALTACMPDLGSKEPTSIFATAVAPTAVSTSDVGVGEVVGELMQYPEAFSTYEMYLDVIGGRPRLAYSGTVEATVESLQRAEVCPYQDEAECRIEPYPSDWGVVRIDGIISYTPDVGTGLAPGEAEQAQSELPQGETSPEYRGPESQPSKPGIEPLEEGQTVQALFLLTTRPAKVRYVQAGAPDGIEPMEYTESGSGETVEHPVGPGKTAFNPIPREGQYYVFTPRIGTMQPPLRSSCPALILAPGSVPRSDTMAPYMSRSMSWYPEVCLV